MITAIFSPKIYARYSEQCVFGASGVMAWKITCHSLKVFALLSMFKKADGLKDGYCQSFSGYLQTSSLYILQMISSANNSMQTLEI